MIETILTKAKTFGDKKWHQLTFDYGLYASYFLMIFALTGILTIDPKYINLLETIIQLYVAIFLMLKFNPIVRNKGDMTKFDRKIAWSAGVFLFLSSTVFATAKAFVKTNVHV